MRLLIKMPESAMVNAKSTVANIQQIRLSGFCSALTFRTPEGK